MALSRLSTGLFATLITTLSYGIAVTLFAQSSAALMRKRRSSGQLNLILVAASSLIFIFATVNIVGIWMNIHEGFVLYPEGPEVFFSLLTSRPKTILQTGQMGAILLADILVVYRTFIIWNSNIYVIVLPCLTFAATFTSGVIFVRLQHVTNTKNSIFARTMTEWTIAFLMCSFVTTVYSTGFIAYKLWNTRRRLHQCGVSTNGSLTQRVGRILVESAGIYSLNHLLYAILYEVKTDVESTPSFMEASIASITCSLIIIRSEEAINRPPALPTTYTNTESVIIPDASIIKEKESKGNGGKIFSLRSLGVGVVDISKKIGHDPIASGESHA